MLIGLCFGASGGVTGAGEEIVVASSTFEASEIVALIRSLSLAFAARIKVL